MSVASVLAMLAAQAEGTATRTGRADYRRAAVILEREAAKARREADAAAERQARRRARLKGDADLADEDERMSRTAARDKVGNRRAGETWTATRRSDGDDAVSLRRLR